MPLRGTSRRQGPQGLSQFAAFILEFGSFGAAGRLRDPSPVRGCSSAA